MEFSVRNVEENRKRKKYKENKAEENQAAEEQVKGKAEKITWPLRKKKKADCLG